ncbi:cytochrome P450 [Schizophyllum amplum]|uniref:Cytochrome P450 n=1 Tax=Schizophyllum amplum TaxID=97359 RepID=A0A550C085_9AGAR|nr:cytochrome P450 [Auriculariopsis ampla]
MAVLDIHSQTIALVLLTATLLVYIKNRIANKGNSGVPLPPGPKGHWLWGVSIPDAFAYRFFETQTQIYGPIFSFRQGPFSPVSVVIGRMKPAVEVMEKEGAGTMDRPRQIAAGETLSGGMRMLLTPAGDRFKKLRRALHSHLQPKSITTYTPTMMAMAKQHLFDIVDAPERHQDHAKQYAAAVVMVLAYGKVPKSYDDPEVQAVNRCLTRLGVSLRPGVWKVDIYPWLKYVPGYLRWLQEGHQEELDLFKTQLAEVKERKARNDPTLKPSFGAYVIEQQQALGLDDGEAAYLAGSMFGAGSDTTASAISVCVMAAATHPEAQEKVAQELEAVIGRGRVPTYADKDVLPQTMAFVLESFRWRPVTAGGAPHKATKDIIWEGQLIPAGATVYGNVWSVGRDPACFPDPEAFNPQRWLDEEGNLREDMKNYPFGFGRRVCPGSHMATASVFLNTALLLWAFKINADPCRPINVLAFTESANAHPQPFSVKWESRFRGKDGRLLSWEEGGQALREALEEYGAEF